MIPQIMPIITSESKCYVDAPQWLIISLFVLLGLILLVILILLIKMIFDF